MTPINQHVPITPTHGIAAQPRARGRVTLAAKHARGRTVLGTLYQDGSARCLLPRRAGPGLEAVLLNTAGGITGGDAFDYAATARDGTDLTVTTQACERAYKAQPGLTGRVRNTLRVGAGARINWLPQETILFNGAALDRNLSIDMAQDATLLMVEPLVFGRTAMGETLTDASLHDRIEIRRAGVPLFTDAMRLEGDIAAHLARPFVAAGACAMAALVYVATDAEGQLPAIRRMLPEAAGATLIAPDVLVLRMLAPDSYGLRTSLLPVLTHLNGADLPRCWKI
ncbi:urease accessory protein UreD [Roseivivax sp. CAU 1753]